MNKILRKLSVVIGFIILIGGVYLSSKIGKSADAEKKKVVAAVVKPNYAHSTKVKNETLMSQVVISGKIIARQKIDLFSEVTGNLNKAGKEFREGVLFKSGELMLTLDDTEAQLDLQATKSQLHSSLISLLPDLESDYADNFDAWKGYIDAFDAQKPIKELPKTKSSREKLFIGARNIETQYIKIKRQEYRLTKYRIYAPFTGVLSNTMTYEGALVRGGQKLGELTHPSRYELEATVSLYDVQFFKKGNKVSLYSEATDEQWTGTVVRYGKTIESKTQTQKIFISVNSSKLNEGMFLNGKITSKAIPNVVQLPRDLLVNNTAVYAIEAGKLTLKTVEVVKLNDNTMYVRGLADETEVLVKNILGSHEGMPVEVIK